MTKNHEPLFKEVEIQGVQVLEDAQEEKQDEQNDLVAKVRMHMPSDPDDAKLQVWRIKTGSNQPIFVDEVPPLAFSNKFLKDNYGGGVYNIKMWVPRFTAEGKPRGVKIAVNDRVIVDGDPLVVPRKEAVSLEREPRDDAIMALGNVMAEGFRQIGELLVKTREPQKTTIDVLKEIAAYKALFADSRPQSDPMEMLKNIIGIVESKALSRLPDDASDAQTTFAFIRELLPQFIDMYKMSQSQAPSLPNPDPVSAVNEALVSIDNAPQQMAKTNGEDMNPEDLIYRGYVALMVKNAKENVDPSGVAEKVYDQLPDDFLVWLLSDEKYLDRIAVYGEKVKMYPIWFNRLREELKKIHDESQAGEDEPS